MGRIFLCDGCHFRNWLVFFPSPTSLEQDIRSPISLHFTLTPMTQSTKRYPSFPNFLFLFVLSSFFFFIFFFFPRTHHSCVISVFSQEILWQRFISNVIRTSNREQFRSWNETEIVIMILYKVFKSIVKENHFPTNILKLGMHKKKYKV